MRARFIIYFLALAINAPNAASARATNPWEDLTEMFDEGVQPTHEAITGWWSGRCFSPENPNTATGQLLIAQEVNITSGDPRHGPAFPLEDEIRFVMAIGGHGPAPDAERYDNLTPKDRADIERLTQTPDFAQLVVYAQDGSFVSYNEPGNLRFEVRRYQNYFVSRSLVIRDQDENIKAGYIFSRCYFFKKVN